MAKEIIRVAAYARTSSSQQHTCKTQLALCTKLAEERGWKVTHKLSDDALQGRNPNRPSYQRLLQLAIDGRVNVIIVWKLDRFFRSLKEASTTQELLQELGVNLVSVTEPFDTTTSIGKFVFLANVAAFETELIKERALLGYERRVSEGKWTGALNVWRFRFLARLHRCNRGSAKECNKQHKDSAIVGYDFLNHQSTILVPGYRPVGCKWE